MAKTMDTDLARQMREDSEQTRDDPYPPYARPTRPNRSMVYSVRLSPEEHQKIEDVARASHLPAATLVRSWILEKLEHAPHGPKDIPTLSFVPGHVATNELVAQHGND
ncbi:MAG: hypothetical protein Q4G30_02555 [Actinomycetaceae bacterium]|nr:hypothetical protein [Actinomycetaceae bacterium]